MPTTATALAIALLAIVPGYIATSVWARARTWKGPTGDLRTILQSIAASAALQVVMSPLTVAWIVPIRRHLVQNPGRVAVWLLLAVLVVPMISGLLVARLSDKLFPSTLSPQNYGRLRRIMAAILRSPAPPTMWDWLFTNRPPNERFVLIEFKDGSQVGGVSAAGSLALTSPEPRGLYLSEEWLLNDKGDFESPLPGTSGILLDNVNEMRWVRILRPGLDPDQQTDGEPHGVEDDQDAPSGAEDGAAD